VVKLGVRNHWDVTVSTTGAEAVGRLCTIQVRARGLRLLGEEEEVGHRSSLDFRMGRLQHPAIREVRMVALAGQMAVEEGRDLGVLRGLGVEVEYRFRVLEGQLQEPRLSMGFLALVRLSKVDLEAEEAHLSTVAVVEEDTRVVAAAVYRHVAVQP
jgi:hypothetical protein